MSTWYQSFSELFWLVKYIVKDLENLELGARNPDDREGAEKDAEEDV